MTAWRLAPLAVMATAWACGPPDRSAHDGPRLHVAVVDTGISLAEVRRVMAPKLSFGAFAYPDSAHMVPVMATSLSSLVRIREAGPVRRGDELAHSHGADRAGTAVTAAHDGMWTPRRFAGQVVAAGDTIGVVRRGHLWLAVGAVGEPDQGVIHPGDSADIRIGKDSGMLRRGVVEGVRRPGTRYPYSAEVSVEFTDSTTSAAALQSAILSVVVHPSHEQDSLLAVPVSAVVQLAGSAAVFALVSPARYQVLWVETGPRVGDAIVVRGTLEDRMQIAVSGLLPLATAAAESVALRQLERGKRR